MKGPEERLPGRDDKGMTLVEIMVAMIILAIALAWLAPMLVTAMRGNRLGGDLTTASTLAQDKIEELRNVSYSSLLSHPAGQDTVGKMIRNWNIAEELGQDGLARITITVSWQDDKGEDHQAQFETMQARAM
jgi:prepilin-type N-terminal cleavage/methylation domain-containing protein